VGNVAPLTIENLH